MHILKSSGFKGLPLSWRYNGSDWSNLVSSAAGVSHPTAERKSNTRNRSRESLWNDSQWTAVSHVALNLIFFVFYMQPLGIREQFFILVCYEASSPNFFWQIFIFAYLVVLQIIGIILSFQTRKVKLQGLNDSKYIATIVYISSIVIVVLALVSFSLRTYINTGTGIFVAGHNSSVLW